MKLGFLKNPVAGYQVSFTGERKGLSGDRTKINSRYNLTSI